MNFFTKVGDVLGGQRPENFTLTNYWDVQGNMYLSYGITRHVDASVQLRVYQDVHQDGSIFVKQEEYNLPDDLFLNLKIGNFGLSGDRVQLGTMFALRAPTGSVHNYPFEPYTAGGFEFGFFGLFSYYNDPFINERDFSFHVNVGWYYYNDSGKTLYDVSSLASPIKSQVNSSSLQYGVGFTYPTEKFDLNLELFGLAFTSQPDPFAHSRENFMYVTPSLRYKPSWRYSFDLGMDIRVSSDEDESDPAVSFSGKALDLPNYFSWRMRLGFNLTLTSGTDKFGSVNDRGDVKERVDFYDRLLREREKTRSIEEELRRLRREREQAEKELEELRQLLEEEGGGN
ncbi:MAG TPA: hypothetical protein PKV71_02810 [Calditrichia bacterium]|nr:hypothetical protein [Calditrichota bacterium]HQU72170.1 hypothetical protein [Calditrichia bacterium]HQV30773.1 hypothetical protein [Calditrichia bacterium]